MSKKVQEIVIICGSYPQVKNTLFVIEQYYPEHPITLMIPTIVADFTTLFIELNKKYFNSTLKLVPVELFTPKRAVVQGIKKVLYLLPDIINERRHQKKLFYKHFSELEGADVFFFDRAHNQYSLVKNLGRRNRLVYISVHPPGTKPVQYTPKKVVDLVRLIIMKLTYGNDMSIAGYTHTGGSPYVSDRFMEREVDSVTDDEEAYEMMKSIDLGKYNLLDTSRYKIMYFDSALYGTSYIKDNDTYIREMNGIFDIVKKYFPEEEIAYKRHPDRREETKVIEIGNILPDYIPAEMLYNDNIIMYFGITSPIANVKKGLAVSIMELISFGSDAAKDVTKDFTIKMSRTKVLFPQSLDEFEDILISITKQIPSQQGKRCVS